MKTLIIHSEIHTKFLISYILHKSGIDNDSIENMDELNNLEGEHNWDCVISDVQFLGTTPDLYLESFFNHQELSGVPLIIVSGVDEPTIRKSAYSDQILDYFSKPFSPFDLVTSVKSVSDIAEDSLDSLEAGLSQVKGLNDNTA